ncbi:MAG: hypothetical protein WBL92_07025 [Methanothrix sp.]
MPGNNDFSWWPRALDYGFQRVKKLTRLKSLSFVAISSIPYALQQQNEEHPWEEDDILRRTLGQFWIWNIPGLEPSDGR